MKSAAVIDPTSTFRARLVYAMAVAATIGLGLASRRFGPHLPLFIAAYSGDTIWAAMAFFGWSMLLPRMPLSRRVLMALVFCYLIEISQLYQAPWINRIRHTTLGALVLGRGFLWSDLLCYTAGISIAALVEAAVQLGCHRSRYPETCI